MKLNQQEARPAAIGRLPLWLKLAYSAFLAVLIPVYLTNYGPANFLYFCDIALLLTLAGVWTENRLLISLPAVGILIPQALWVVDFAVQLSGHSLTGMTAYMFDQNRSLFLRGLSLFHGWLPFLLIYLVCKLGYDRRALPIWTLLALSVCLICFFLMPPAGAHLADPKAPININYVFGFDDAHAQTWLRPSVYLGVWMFALFLGAFIPAHLALCKLARLSASRPKHSASIKAFEAEASEAVRRADTPAAALIR
jgi:hypothetical protein